MRIKWCISCGLPLLVREIGPRGELRKDPGERMMDVIHESPANTSKPDMGRFPFRERSGDRFIQMILKKLTSKRVKK